MSQGALPVSSLMNARFRMTALFGCSAQIVVRDREAGRTPGAAANAVRPNGICARCCTRDRLAGPFFGSQLSLLRGGHDKDPSRPVASPVGVVDTKLGSLLCSPEASGPKAV